MSDTSIVGGGCLCGATRYRVEGPQLRGTICHCNHCKRWSGAPFLSWSLFNKNQFQWIKGKPGTTNVTPAVNLHFCKSCGSPLTFEFTDSCEIVGATTGTLDEPENFSQPDTIGLRARCRGFISSVLYLVIWVMPGTKRFRVKIGECYE